MGREAMGVDVMLSQATSLTRLRFYERECRQQATTATDSISRAEHSKFADIFQKAVRDLESVFDDFEAQKRTNDEDRP
jgi:hypothetical protein